MNTSWGVEFVRRPQVQYAAMLAVLVVLPLAMWQAFQPKDDVAFCRGVFQDLANGRRSVERRIAWEQFHVMGVNVGGTYLQQRTERDRTRYRMLFIRNFSEQFKKNGGRVGEFGPWRLAKEETDGRRWVAARLPHHGPGEMVFVVSEIDPRRVEWMGLNGPPSQQCESCHGHWTPSG